ncbi:DEAD/DEAH box helicase family protein [Streptomyces salinarius]|uniref:DEAD/DEAH box helicase family protein n=1 Tax=Streptomyces salinarius TaxID=2762598 RepID=UPI00164476B0|nr:DEAD/DEAH box helicase family protein [Streptomyces salinarius]
MGERFATPEDVRGHWRLGGGDPYRISETKDEAANRRSVVWRRDQRASEVELVGEHLVIARMDYEAGRYRWGVFHAGTAQPVLMLEYEHVKPEDNGARARALAEALDQWRDAATGEPFDWTSQGLIDRLRSPYGYGMLDQVRGRDPEARWAGTAPADVTAWPTDDGQEYAYDSTLDKVTVYDPDGLLIARGERKFDPKTRKSAFLGEMRDGRRISGQRSNDFVQNAVWQHRIAQLEPGDRDELWIYYLDHRPIVHGTDRYADDWPDMKALLRSAGFTYSSFAKAYVTAGTTRTIARAQSVDRLARALYAQGRMVEIRADEDRLRGVLAPAAPAPAAARTAVLVPAAAAEASPAAATPEAPAAPTPAAAPVLTPQDLTDEQLAAEIQRLEEERRGAAYGSARHKQLDEQIAPLKQENERRQVAQVENRPDPAGMEDGGIAAERETLAAALGRPALGYENRTPLAVARRERDELLRAEQARRTAAELEARPPVVQLTDEELQAEGAQLVKDRHKRPQEAADAFGERVAAVGAEIADRRLLAWGEQPPAEGLDDVELTEALEALRGRRLSDTEFAGSIQAKDRVEKAFTARRHVLQEEVKRRDEKAFRTLLETDGRIRLESWGHDSKTHRVKIDNRFYGEITDYFSGWRARLWRGRDTTREEAWRTDALRWLIGEYEKDPETRDTRTWGAYVPVELPPAFVDHLTTRFSDLTLSGEAEKYLIRQVADSSRSQSWDETGKKIMVHALDVPERALPVLERMGRRLVDRLDDDLDSDDRKTRDRAKRARPNVLRALDDLVALMEDRGLEPLGPDNASAGAPQDGEADSERVREDGPPALGDVPAAGAVADGGPGGVLPGAGDGRAGTDRGADRGEDGRSDAGDGPPAAGGQAEGGPADGPGAGAEGDRVPGAGGGQPGRGAAPLVFRPASQEDLAPAGERAKAAANLEAVRVLKRVQEEKRAATAAEQQVMARWSGWGSVPEIFAARPREDDPVFGPGGEREGGYAAAVARWESFADVRDPLRVLLDDDEWRAAAASTLSAHYTPPEITSALWQALADLGFDGGEVLEPGSGAGVTFGTAPESARLTGVEIDPTSAAISRLLAPGVTVLNESFADTVAPDGSFDGVVGNVPFARVSLYDPKHNRGRHRLHNHFLIKSVALTRPGGVVALITSRHTLDAESAAARGELFEMADLLGAVRLPNKAFARSAGTDVVTDIVVLRRRMDGEEPLDRSWLTSSKRAVGEHQLPVNDYFAAHPEHVLGTLTSRMGAHGPEVAVDGDPDVGEALRTALRQVTDSAVLARRWYAPHPEGPYRPPLRLKPAADLQDFTGRLSADVEGKLWQTSGNGELVAVELPAKQHAQLAALIELKDLVRGLNELDRSGSDLALADAHRRLTKGAYERYVAAHGPLSRPGQQQNVTTRTDDGESVAGLTAWGYFLNDPQAYEVLALEMWEADTETVHVSEILDHAPAARRSVLGQHTDDPQQALDAVVAERGHVDLAHIAWMLQVDEDEARRRLARSVFTDPLTGDLLYSADYLSGDVRTKLEIARQATQRDAAFQVNVAELERVQPREMLPGQFAIRLGAAWLPDDLVQQFFREYLGDAHLTIQHSGNGNWHILKGRGLSEEDEVKHSAGGLHPLALLNRVLNGGSMTGRPSDDEEAARAVRVKAEEWRDAFEAWVLDDSVRAARAADVYNRQMNNRVVRDFTGTRPSLTGLDPDFTPYDHQLAAAARMAHERCLVLSHVVGAGKTATLAIGMMAMKNTGQIDKPLVVVPNYLVEQWEGEVRRVFPTARILTLTSADLADGRRDRMLQYVRANSFDLVIMSHSLFDSIPLSPEFYEFYNDEELRKLDAQILHERRREGKSISLKQLQERRQQHEQSLKEKAAAVRTPGQVYVDDLGFDFFAIDEFHEYKNLAVRSKIPGARVSGSAKAQHLHAVLEWARRNKPTGPIGCLATATPLANAIGELHTLLLMANPDLLRNLGIEEFDAFATMYGKMVERLEMTVDGKGFKSVERFASFHSVNSLLRQLWLPVVDYKDEEDLGLPLPSIRGGEPELMLVPATTAQEQLMQELGERYEAYHLGEVDKSEDNPLSINTDARVIALDPRLIDAQAEPGNKLRLLADRVAAEYHATKSNQYTYSTEDLRPHPVPGGLQMVFLNQGTPGGKNRGGFNAYQEFKNLLIARDVPVEKIDFIHDATRADQRRKLVARANHGGSNVLIGSTQRMGKGLNAQNRCTTVYHVDPDFRPADMKQKDGRGRRKGNQNKVVGIVWVATENTFDSRMYGTLATKAKGFDQVYKARLDAGSDEIQEVDEAIVPYEEAMAIISGNPYLIAQEELRKQLRTLTLDQNNRATQRAIVHKKVQQLNKDIDALTRDINRRGAVLPSLRPIMGDDFEIALGGVTYTKHKDAAVPLTDALAGVLAALPEARAFGPETTLGQLGGRDLVAVAFREDNQEVPFVRVHLDGLPGSLQRFDAVELSTLKGETLLRRLTKTITEAPDRQTEDEGNLAAKRATRDELLVYSEQLRGQVPGLSRARERLSLVDALVAAQIAVNKAGEPSKDESAAETEKRKQAIERRDGLQRQLERFDATPPAEASSKAGEALPDLDELRPRDPALLSPQQRESEAAILRAHIAVHGDPDGTAADRLAELEMPLVAESLNQRMDGLVNPAANKGGDGQRPAPEPPTEREAETAESTESRPAGSGGTLQELIDGFGDRVMVGHIGGQQPAAGSPGESSEQPTKQPAEQPEAPAETAVAPPVDEDLDTEEADAPAPDGDGYGTADLYETFGLTQPERVPLPEPEPEAEPEAEEPAGVSDGQMTVEEVQPEAAPDGPDAAASRNDGRVRLTSADGRLTFTLLEVPADADFHQEAVEGYQRRLSEFTAVVETKNEQATQTPAERAEHLARWRRTFKVSNGLEPFRPLPSLRLTPRADGPGLTPAEYGIGSWLTWRDGQSGEQVTGQVMGPGPAGNTWFVSTDRTGHTGEYHVLSRSGKKATGYTYSLNGAATDLRPADGPGQQLPLEALPQVDAVPARPVTSYADWVPTTYGLAPVREPIPVTVGEMGPRFDPAEVAFDVVADGIPFVVRLSQNDETLTSTFVPRVESDGEVVVEFDPLDSRGEAVDFCVRVAREAREMADKPLYAQNRNYDFALANEGVCGRCSRNHDDNDVKELYRVDGSDPECIHHLCLRCGAAEKDVAVLARARRIWAVRTDPGPEPADTAPPADTVEPAEAPAAPETVVASQDPHEVGREALQGGNRITTVVSGRSIEWDGDAWGVPVPETVTITGTVYPGYRDYHQNATLLDAEIRGHAGQEVIAAARVFVRLLPAQVQLIPVEHREDLRPEPRTVAHVRLGDLIAEGGTRGESVTELRFADNNRRGSVMAFSTRDVATGADNGFALNLTEEVLVVPRERRAPQDVAAVFGRHGSHHQVGSETQRTYDLHAAVAEVASRVWPDGSGPQDEVQALSAAIGAIDATVRGADAYRANAAAMETAAAAAAALFAATDEDMLNRYVGRPLHRLRQHLDVQAHRLYASAAHLDEHAAAAPAANPSTADEPTPPNPEERDAQDQPTERTRGGEDVASQGAGETEQLGLFGDPAQDPAEGRAEPETAAGSGPVPADELPAQSAMTEDGREAQLRAALIEGETIAPVSFTDRREPTAGWILTTAAGHTFQLRPVPYSRPDEDQWEAGHDADGSYWWNANLEDLPLAAVLARIREDSATRTRFASLWARYGHLTAQAPQFETTTDRVQLEEGVYLVRRFGRIGLIASCRWGWEHLTDPDGAQGRTGEDWSRKGPDNRQYVAEWKIWNSAEDAIPNARLRVVAQLTDDMANTPDAYCDASQPYVGKCSAKRSGARYTVAVDDDQGSELGHYTVCARCLSHRLLNDEDRRFGYRDVESLVGALAKGDPKVVDLHWKQWPDRIAEVAGQMLSTALDAGETAPWPAQTLTSQILTEACEAGDDRAMREARAEVKAAGGNAKARKRAADEVFAARQDRAALVARYGLPHTDAANEADRAAVAILELAGWEVEGSGAASEPAEAAAPGVVDVNALTVSPRDRDGEPSPYEFTVTGPGLAVGEYEIVHDAQGPGARGIVWRAYWRGVEPSGRWDVISIGSGEGESAALAAVAEHAAAAGGDLAAKFTVARRMRYDARLWLLPEVGEAEAIEYHPDGSWTITAETGVPYTVRQEWEGRTASGDLAPLLIEDQAGTLIASCTAVDGYMSAWAPMLERLRLHATAVADGVPHATVVTLGGPTQEWVEAWCVCSWTERADVAEYAGRAAAGEALALAHRQAQLPETSAAAEAPAAAELPELDVVLPDVGLATLDVAAPYETDEEAQADIDRLSTAFARWDALPTVQRFYEADRQQRPDGQRIPTNPVAQLSAAYRDAERMLREGPTISPDDLVLEVHTVAVWSGALEPVVDEDLRGPLRQVREAAALLASRSQATVVAFEAELAALTANSAEQNTAAPESAAADAEPAEQPPADTDDAPGTGTEPGPDAPAAEGLGEAPATDTEPESATDDTPAPEAQEVPEPPAAADDAPGDTAADTAPGDPAADSDPAPDGVTVPQDAPEPAGAVPDEGMHEARREASFLEQDRPQTTDGDQQTPEPDTATAPTDPDPDPAPAGEDTPSDETARDASEEPTMTTPPIPETTDAPDEPMTEEPPAPQRYFETVPLAGDPRYQLRLSGLDGQRVDSGDLLRGDLVIATIHPSSGGGWYARLDDERLPTDVTSLADTPEGAAVNAAIMYSAFTSTPYGPPPGAAIGDETRQRVDVLRTDLRDAAVQHREAVAGATARAYPNFEQNEYFRELVSSLDGLAAAVSDAHGSQQMTHYLDGVQRAVNNWGGALPADPGDPERRQLAFPLAHLLYDSRRLQDQVQATLAAVQAEQAAVREQAAHTEPGPEARPEPEMQSEPAAPADAGASEELTESQNSEVPDSQTTEMAREETPAAPAEPTDTAGPESPDGAAPPEDDGPALDSAVDGIRRALEDALQTAQPEEAAQPGELPLWTGTEAPPVDTAATEPPAGPLDVRAEFQAVLEAWEKHVPPENGTAQDLVAELDADLATLQRAFAEAVAPAAPAAPPPATNQDATAPDESAEAAAPPAGRQQAADVNTALQQADTHATALQDLPEWQQIQTVRGAFGHLFRVMKERAGERFNQLMGDHRVGEFFRKVSINACEKIAGWAQAGADRLRRRGEEKRTDAAAADALRDVADAASTYSSPGGGRGGTPPAERGAVATTVDIPEMRKLGAALSRPLPGARDGRGTRVSTAAARGKSTTRGTVKKPGGSGKKKAGGTAEQAGHLRRGGTDPQQQNPKPSQR